MAIPFRQARWFTKGRIKPIRLMVIHDMEAPELVTTAENIAGYFANQGPDRKKGSSTHYNIDSDSVVQSVKDGDTAWCAPGANADGLHFEHAGYAKQTRDQWLDPYGVAMLERSAALVAAKCHEFNVPPVKLDAAGIKAGKAGVVGHWDVTKAFPDKGSHTDPGSGFPWDYYMGRVKAHFDGTAQEDDMPSAAEVADEMLKRPVKDLYGKTVTVGEAIGITLRNTTQGALDARVARNLSEAQAKSPTPLTDEEIQRIAEATAREVGEGFTVEGAIVPKAQS